mgnify:CR=1 FL=1
MERGAIQVKRNNDTGKEMWRPMPRKDLMNRSDAEIVSTFNSEIRGLYNFYRIAEKRRRIAQVLLHGAVQHVKKLWQESTERMSVLLRSGTW